MPTVPRQSTTHRDPVVPRGRILCSFFPTVSSVRSRSHRLRAAEGFHVEETLFCQQCQIFHLSFGQCATSPFWFRSRRRRRTQTAPPLRRGRAPSEKAACNRRKLCHCYYLTHLLFNFKRRKLESPKKKNVRIIHYNTIH